MRSVNEVSNCLYSIEIYTNKACDFIAPVGVVVAASKGPSVFSYIFSFWAALIIYFLWVLYYMLVIFVIYNIYRIIRVKMDNPNAEVGFPYKERAAYYYTRVKHYFSK